MFIKWINLGIGIFIIVNLTAFILIYLKQKTKILEKMNEKLLIYILIFLSAIGGYIGVKTAGEMYEYKIIEKPYSKIMKYIVAIEVFIILYYIYKYVEK